MWRQLTILTCLLLGMPLAALPAPLLAAEALAAREARRSKEQAEFGFQSAAERYDRE